MKNKTEKRKRWLLRVLIYFAGIWTVSFGIVLCVKSGLGISPVSSIPYVLSLATPLTLGVYTMFFHFINTGFQYVMEKKIWNPKILLQIPVAFLFGFTIDLIKKLLVFPVTNLGIQIACLAFSIFFTALGMVLMINMKLVQNPPDGSVKVISGKMNLEMGKVKVAYDCTMVLVSIALSLCLLKKVEGFGIATIASAALVGRTLSALQAYAGEKLNNIIE